MKNPSQSVIEYYRTKESRWGYKFVLGGTKHFGYYPKGKEKITLRQSMRNMTDKLGEAINLPAGSIVLDAGCGEGTTALGIAERFNLKVEGIDLLDFNILNANKRLALTNLKNSVHFSEGDYTKLQFKDEYFDGVYTMETLVHAPDYKKALQEFNRVLKKNGKLVLFEYSLPMKSHMTRREYWAFQTIGEGSAMHSFMSFTNGSFPKILTQAGFRDVKVEDVTDRITPMLKRFWNMGIIPYQIITLLGKQKKYVNTTSSVELYRYRDKFRYNIITATKL